MFLKLCNLQSCFSCRQPTPPLPGHIASPLLFAHFPSLATPLSVRNPLPHATTATATLWVPPNPHYFSWCTLLCTTPAIKRLVCGSTPKCKQCKQPHPPTPTQQGAAAHVGVLGPTALVLQFCRELLMHIWDMCALVHGDENLICCSCTMLYVGPHGAEQQLQAAAKWHGSHLVQHLT